MMGRGRYIDMHFSIICYHRQRFRRQKGWDSARVLISVDRLAKEKNRHTLLDAAAEVMRTLPDVRRRVTAVTGQTIAITAQLSSGSTQR
ncbi:MAG: hypothetical protein KC419_04900 [Anaerolineales bacterium]|nr:hypothetical protein [Anaerolineales bacterium]